jgi:glycosyltransferase involved in cell wall biosynthesis
MVPALLDCIRRPERVQALARAGRRLVEDSYDWQILAQRLERVWRECVSAGPRAA